MVFLNQSRKAAALAMLVRPEVYFRLAMVLMRVSTRLYRRGVVRQRELQSALRLTRRLDRLGFASLRRHLQRKPRE